MSQEPLNKLANRLYSTTVFMLDYDYMGLTFDEEVNGDSLFNHLVKVNNYALKKLSKKEFGIVIDILIKRLEELSFTPTENKNKSSSNTVNQILQESYSNEKEEFAISINGKKNNIERKDFDIFASSFNGKVSPVEKDTWETTRSFDFGVILFLKLSRKSCSI